MLFGGWPSTVTGGFGAGAPAFGGAIAPGFAW